MAYRPIQKLPEEIIGKIAAGEVVESPTAAIKELVENSIDAGATNISVEIREGGIAYFRVTDNGTGIRRSDVRMAFERHATSKIDKADDLFNLSSLGFRGEALASIAAVSKVTLTTRTKDDERGTRVLCDGGVIKDILDAASPEGTTIVARDLFYNTPVRLKFLKKPSTEGARVCDMMLRLIVSHPEVAFRLIHNEKQIYMSPGNGDLRSVAFCLYGKDAARDMVQVGGTGSIGVHGLIGIGPLARSNRVNQTFVINGRYVKSALLSQALEDACKERVTIGHYPICLLHIDMAGAMVDVNVHPNKLEVRFSNEELVYQNVKGAVADSFINNPLEGAPSMTLTPTKKAAPEPIRVEITPVQPPEMPAPQAPTPAAKMPEERAADDTPPSAFSSFVSEYFGGETKGASPLRERAMPLTNMPPLPFAPYPDEEAPAAPREARESAAENTPMMEAEQQELAQVQSSATQTAGGEELPFKVVGIVFDTYILLEQNNRMLMVDQHAAHERILYERLMKSVDTGSATQGLLVAQVVPITPVEKERLETYGEAIREAGFDIEFFGEDAVRIQGVPMVLGMPQAKAAFMDVMDHLGDLRVLSTREKRRDSILQMACKHAVKGGDKLSVQEVLSLLGDVLVSEAPPTCPHGRPLVIALSRTEIEKKFKRINH